MPAKLIVFEGPNCAGKTTQAKMLFELLKNQRFRVLYTKEPQASGIGAVAKGMIRKENFSPEAVAIAFAADTMHHIDEIIKPALNTCDFIILDRYYHSAYAYHPLIGCRREWIRELHRYVMKPDIVFLLDIPIVEFKKRVQKEQDAFENVAFQEKLRAAYLELPKILAENFAVVDGTKSIEAIHSDIMKKVMFL